MSLKRFNTASGKCCCNTLTRDFTRPVYRPGVSIPQAVSAVATALYVRSETTTSPSFQYRKR